MLGSAIEAWCAFCTLVFVIGFPIWIFVSGGGLQEGTFSEATYAWCIICGVMG